MTHPEAKAVLELLKPVTWFPPMWAFGCGVVSSGQSTDGRWSTITVGVLLVAAVVGLVRDRDAATINNVAFALLHVAVLSHGMAAAIVPSSAVIQPDA